jgi:hypothetical protein
VQVLGEIFNRYDLPCHFLVQHDVTPFKMYDSPRLAGLMSLAARQQALRESWFPVTRRIAPGNSGSRLTAVSAEASRQKLQLKAYDCDASSVNKVVGLA